VGNRKKRKPHYALKCDRCATCVREGDEERRRGCVQMTFWTPAGPLALFLCGRCAEKVRHECCDEAAVEERVQELSDGAQLVFSPEMRERVRLGKYTHGMENLTEGELAGLLWLLGEYEVRSGYLTDDPHSRRTVAHNAIIDFMRNKRRTLDLVMELMRKAD
jgi:hypothetical protein